VCLNPKDIPPDDLDDVILGRMIKEAGMFYKMELELKNNGSQLVGVTSSGRTLRRLIKGLRAFQLIFQYL